MAAGLLFSGDMRLSLLVLTTLLSGCSTTYALRATELEVLDGYDARVDPTPRVVESVSGRTTTFDGKNLSLRAGGAPWVTGEFLKVDIHQQRLLGSLRGGQTIDVALTDLREVRITQFSAGKTVGLVFAIIAAIVVPTAIGFGIYGLSQIRPTPSSSSGRCFLVCGE